MKTYRVTLSREVTQTHDLDIEAENEDEACEQAESEIDNIADDDWDDVVPNSDPEIDKVVELADDGEEAAGEDEDKDKDEDEDDDKAGEEEKAANT